MYSRILKNPDKSFFLFGPRGTGKTTWIKDRFQNALGFDLLDSATFSQLLRNPGDLYTEVSASNLEWVVIDEIQRVPALLNEVHRSIENLGRKFVLSGSSARKLRRPNVNLLAGRALTRTMFPLTSHELGSDFDVDRALQFGTLPTAINSSLPADYLRSYAHNYLVNEIQTEAQIRDLAGFARFLEVATRQNAQLTNAASISRDVAVARTTVQSYFEVLRDTLIAYWLPPWKLKRSNKQVSSSKFYMVDCGIVRALSERLVYPIHDEERGPLFETLVINEIRAYLDYMNLHFPLYFFRTYSGLEVDVLFETLDGFVAIETKSSTRWERKFNRGLHTVAKELGDSKVHKFGVFNGVREQRIDGVRVMPIREFLRTLWAGALFDQ